MKNDLSRKSLMEIKKILVVGGAGYIGSQVNKLLQQEGYQTVVFDNLSRGSKEAVLSGKLFKGDLANLSDLENVFTEYKFDAVIHFAALSNIGESLLFPALYYQSNVVNTLNLLSAMKRHHVPFLIFSSSAAIFGLPQQPLIDESHPCLPLNAYGQSKLIVEMMLQEFDRAYNFKSCCLRYFNAAGADPDGEIYFDRKESNLIPLLLKSLKNPAEKVTLFGSDHPTPDGTCIRDYIHVYDLAKAHIKAMELLFEGKSAPAYNLGNARGYSVREVIKAVEKVTSMKITLIEGERRPGEPPSLIANPQKAKQELGWQSLFPDLETMVAHYWNAFNTARSRLKNS